MLSRLVLASIRFRTVVLVLFGLLLGGGAFAVRALPIDAMPDVSTIQVSVLTTASGLSAVEVERTVTVPIENALNGIPGGVELRSVSRGGLSAVTVVFKDGTDVWFARQLVLERVRTVERELPASAGTPELGPVSSGLGEIFQFVVRSDQHSPMQLRTLLDWEIVPKLRAVPGVIEVNTMGGELKQFQVVIDRARLKAHHLTVDDVIEALRAANVNVGGGYVERREEPFTVRGQGMLRDESDIRHVVLRTDADGAPVLVQHVAEVTIGAALRHGVITHGGEREAVTGIVMMLLGANSREVVSAVGQRVKEIQSELPPGVTVEVVYDRADFVGRTIGTVLKNLAEGVLVVTVVLALFLGTLRGAIAVVLGIPAAMTIAVFGMHLFGVTGDLFAMLLWMFQNVRIALGVFLMVPLSLVGGMLGLMARGMPFSLSAAVGFIALGGVAVLNGVVIASEVQRRLAAGESLDEAVTRGPATVVRAVLTTAAVAALGFLPMAIATSAGAEVQRPLATVVIAGMFFGTVLALAVLPGVLRLALSSERRAARAEGEGIALGEGGAPTAA